MKYASIQAIEDFINNHCVDCLYATDSVVGLGNLIYTTDNGKLFIVNERVANCWSSNHYYRFASKISKAMQKMIESQDNILNQDDE